MSKMGYRWIYLCSFPIVIHLLIKYGSIELHPWVYDATLLVAILIPTVIVVFAMPSTYVSGGVAEEDVKFVEQQLRDMETITKANQNLLKESIDLFEEKSQSRINTLKWLVRSLWSICGVLTTLICTQNPNINLPVDILFLISIILITLTLFLAVSGYEKAINKLFMSIKLGCKDFMNTTKPVKHTD